MFRPTCRTPPGTASWRTIDVTSIGCVKAGLVVQSARIVGRWVDGCAADGFDAVEFDNLDSFTRSHGLIERRQALAYARLLVRAAHVDPLLEIVRAPARSVERGIARRDPFHAGLRVAMAIGA